MNAATAATHQESHNVALSPQNSARPARGWYVVLCAAVLAGVTWWAHGPSVYDGLFFDDHWHRLQLETRGWSWHDLLETATLEPSRFVDMWWQTEPVRWQYARPVSILLMKVVYALSGGSVMAQHVMSLALHYANACMVAALAWRLTRHRYWSLVAGLLFVIYSHSVFAVGWLAAQNTVFQTALTLAAMLVYLRATGLCIGPEASLATTSRAGGRTQVQSRERGDLRGLAAVLGLYLLALFTRENAVMLPVILLSMDVAFGGVEVARWRAKFYATLGVVTIAFLVWRLKFYYYPMPDVYSRRPDGADYPLWMLYKFLHYICSAIWLSPMVVGPTGRFNPFVEVPGDCLLAIVIILVLGGGYWWATRRVRGWWIWPLWLVLAYLPVVPIMPTPHQGYLGGVGFAIAMIMGPAMRRQVKPFGWRISAAVATWFLIATSLYMPIYRTLWNGMQGAERLASQKLATLPPPKDATDLYFINLPFVNIYTKLCLREAWGPAADRYRVHVLTFAPDVTGMASPCEVTQVDDHTLRVEIKRPSTPDGWTGYFSGLLGRFLLRSMGNERAISRGDPVSSPDVETEIEKVDEHGVWAIRFRFRKPLFSPTARYYLSTASCPMAELRLTESMGPNKWRPPDGSSLQNPHVAAPPIPLADRSANPEDVRLALARVEKGIASAAGVLFAVLADADHPQRGEVRERFGPIVEALAEATGSSPWRDGSADWREAADWWRRNVDDRQLKEVWLDREQFEATRYQRDGIFRVKRIASMIIRTDLYMTGPPFPGPRVAD